MSTYTKANRPLIWLITGCSSGLGLELTRIAQANGDKVIATSRNPARTPNLVDEVQKHGGEWHALDVDDPSAPGALLQTLAKSGSSIDILVNNAGVIHFGLLEQFTDEGLRGQMETLYFGPQRLIRAVLPGMRERRFGVIVNISSGAALDGNGSMGAYAAAKAALDASTRVLAKEVSSFNIRPLTVWLGTLNTNIGNVSPVLPGPVPDDYRGSAAEQMMEAIRGRKFAGNGHKGKAAKAIYEVVVGEGAGAGREEERFLPLGADMVSRIGLIRDQSDHALQVFGEISNGIAMERR
ncbi:hypothetical protein N7478_009541 [Penicillium angulare]|uniref:uncharacterized protein n=1 Tax=Penicillium angulare TaxID=116970 RepID=UPI0025423465|nr:uncharacterized protein N7478_009541 [Penicillium angulare]KAJ5266733.1 hypothetical protein N7478_009541 [Penicillium angulare]